MDFNLAKLLSSLEELFKGPPAKPSKPPTEKIIEKLLQPQKPYTLRDQLYEADKEIGAPSGTHYGILVAENGGLPRNKLPVSPKGAVGIAQQTPAFLAEMKRLNVGNYDPLNPVLAISRVTFDLKRNYDHFKNWDKAVAAYNAGRQRVINAGSIVNLPRETRDYVDIVNQVVKTGKGPRGGTSVAFEQYLDTPVSNFFKEK